MGELVNNEPEGKYWVRFELLGTETESMIVDKSQCHLM